MTDHLRECLPIDYSNGEIMNIPNAMPTLSRGSHAPYEGQACVMEYVALLAGEEWSDSPACTHPALSRAAREVNDNLSDTDRHLLVPLIGSLFGTSAPVDDQVFALRIARTVEHLSAESKACNDVTGRFLNGEATEEELRAAQTAASAAAAAAAYAAAAYDAAYAAAAAAEAASALVNWLSSMIDIYYELSGRTTHREVTDQDLAALALAVKP